MYFDDQKPKRYAKKASPSLTFPRSNPGVMGGQLRNLPTFIINFRLPWGILLAYFEIPEVFVPFVKAG
jgi:hypothetical protein